ncbi:MAG: ribbon-helix-helix protein, CopG family [Gammaproteobacteria bacterium]|nr:ribbon-helix-helix protein, CopG family [Gammaproteobacteria bacterium]MXW10579.1 ribbon-helix-helix protein, CopG family [Gammaproteobacteria bacterium]MYC53311.1 ribbon-helix-helix protein, CopG family [Gammaproteobacteria bacterium]
MHRIVARVPDELSSRLDAAAGTLRRSRSSIIRAALEDWLEDVEDARLAASRLGDSSDLVLDWGDVRAGLLR